MSAGVPSCYNALGNQVSYSFPCSTDGSLAQCCLANAACASNGFCVNAGIEALTPYYWSGCTDPTWKNKGCSSECLDSTRLTRMLTLLLTDMVFLVGSGIDVCSNLGPG